MSVEVNKIFVGGLAWQTHEDALRDAFSPYGELEEVRIVTDRNTGRSKGFGFVSYKSKEDAEEAISKLNGTDLDGRPIRCELATPREGGGGGDGGDRMFFYLLPISMKTTTFHSLLPSFLFAPSVC